MKSVRPVWALLALLLTLPGVSAAQGRVASAGAWQVECSTDKMTDKRGCYVITSFSSHRSPIYELDFRYSSTEKLFFGLGAPAPTRVRVKVDSNPPLTIDICSRGVCALKAAESARLLQQMRSGTTLLVEFSANERLPKDPFSVSLSGFDAMLQQAARP